ncbi:hypothetical protein ACHAXA_004099 [Cyclostephanos tholiformis]|uniref:Uncharacterized protein n=1 Tax=Cyclostephanos tholiformis TaxID=382380 RepID=A0ABD3SHA8_9STRA
MMSPPSSSGGKVVIRSLYRSLLRASSPFSPPHPMASTYASLLHRTGISHDWEECVHVMSEERARRRRLRLLLPRSSVPKYDGGGGNIPESWARDLSRSYIDLREEYASRRKHGGAHDGPLDGGRSSRTRDAVDAMMNDSNDSDDGPTSVLDDVADYYCVDEDPKFVLFRHLLRELFAGGVHDDVDANAESGGERDDWPWRRGWSPDEAGYYENNGTVRRVPLLRFPCQISGGTDDAGAGPSVRDIIRREFRAMSADERTFGEIGGGGATAATAAGSTTTTHGADGIRHPPSSYVDDDVRVQTAFYALMELNRKLAWAERMGFPAAAASSSSSSSSSSSYQRGDRNELLEEAERRRKRRSVQAAKGVRPLSSVVVGPNASSEVGADGVASTSAIEPPPSRRRGHRRRLRRQFSPGLAPTIGREVAADGTYVNEGYGGDDRDDGSSPLRCGTYLIAHPLMTGYFARSIIVILDHTEERDKASETEGGDSNGVGGNGGGGTYGLIINRLALQPEMADPSRRQLDLLRRIWEEKKSRQLADSEGGGDDVTHDSSVLLSNDSLPVGEPTLAQSSSASRKLASPSIADTSHNILRPISLLQAINADDLPEAVQMAFGDSPMREGGPVNLSVQMIHRRALEKRDNRNVTDDDNVLERDGSCAQKRRSPSKIGGTMLGYEHGKLNDSGDAIYFGGDVMEASYAVLNGTSDRDDFSFVIGAACWAPGQLEHEIERGCWLPFSGPPAMALTGICEHNEVPESVNDGENIDKGTKLSQFPPRPSNLAKAEFGQSSQPVTRPVGDLWLSVMCALGEGEADLAFMMLDQKNVSDPFGDACDNFERSSEG